MKKFITNTLVLILVCLSCVMPVKADTSKVKVTIPTFKVTLNGQLMDNQYNQYPLLVYKGITYFPMTYYGSRFLGLRANWYQNAKYYSHKSVLFIGVCPQSEKQTVLKVTKNKRKNLRSYTASVANYGLALNTTTADQFINNATEKYPILNFRGISYFPLTWKYAVDEFGWQYSYDNKNGLVINSGDAFRPIVDDSIIGRTLPSANVRKYFYSKDYYVVYPHSTYAPVYKMVIRKRGDVEKEYDLETELNNGKYSIYYLNVAKNQNGAFVNSKPYIDGNILYMNCEGREKNSDNSTSLQIKIGINLENGKIVSEDIE